MKKIDRETTQRIIDAADIVEVVSDFVTLKRRGANYIGLCPFHNERTPSFSVSKSKGICKCFSCGKGGTAVNFLMELESMSYYEALLWLAKKYGIEVKEREVTAEERKMEMERESMLAVNDFAMKHFEHIMADTDDGRNIGMAYFRERGINEASCKKFHLGYSLEKSDDLYRTAISSGYKEEFLLATGLCAKSERGIYDRFRGRVMYPVFTLSGRVVAFGGRTLRTDKSMAKYVNSPESVIYSKSRELYGLYQAKQAITRKDKCILVEGYMDVISMHQAGIENVVASSGTSLTDGQIRLIHRFTENITVIYDSDAAGIKASLRGIDMLLAEGMNVKVLSLPDGDDPDSFAQSHSCAEVEEYLEKHETDFIHFKSAILLKDTENDPIKRAKAISSIVRSISVIPNQILRQVYIDECSRRFGMDDKVLSLQVSKFMAENLEEKQKQKERKVREDVQPEMPQTATPVEAEVDREIASAITSAGQTDDVSSDAERKDNENKHAKYLAEFEREVIRYALRYGVMYLCDGYDENNSAIPMTVLDYLESELRIDNIGFDNPLHGRIWEKIAETARATWNEDVEANEEKIQRARQKAQAEGLEKIRNEAKDVNDIHARELQLETDIDKIAADMRMAFERHYIEKKICSDFDDDIRRLATDLASDKYTLSKVHTKYTHVETEEERLKDLVPRALSELRNAQLTCRIEDVKAQIVEAGNSNDNSRLDSLLQKLMEMNEMKRQFARYLGDRIIDPTKL